MQKAEEKGSFFCLKCKKKFAHRRGLLAHTKTFHPEDVDQMLNKPNVICPICNCRSSSIFELHKHFKEAHSDLALMFEEHSFHTEDDFNEWKENLEKESLSRFVKRRSPLNLADGRKVSHYFCHRSGTYRREGKGERRLKTLGSNKIEKSCPAHIAVYLKKEGDLCEIKVNYQSVHVGHEIDIRRIPLLKSDKDVLARKLYMDVPESSILNDLQEIDSPTKKISPLFRLKSKKKFAHKRGELAHTKKLHPEDVDQMLNKPYVICPICNCSSSSIFKLHNHFKEKHSDLALKFEEHSFYFEKDFNEWKENLEKESLSRFVKRRPPFDLGDGRKVSHYFCHKSGTYRREGKGKCRLKILGSNKIEKSCPAHIAVYWKKEGDLCEIKVNYQSVHVGHEIDLGKIPLSKSDKDVLAGKLLMDVPKSSILNDLQEVDSPTKKISTFFCLKCKKKFAHRRGLLAHTKKSHPEDVDQMLNKPNVICPICNCRSSSIFELHNHFKEEHSDLALKFQEHSFYTEDDFNEWKENLEKESLSRFVKRRPPLNLADGRKVSHYFCHRSGTYRKEGKGERKLKTLGSNKIEKSCPAHIAVYWEKEGDLCEIKVNYQSEHVGHEIDIRRIPLSKSDKDVLAGKLLMDVPKSSILNDLQKVYSPTKRISLTHRKDLHNIERDYGRLKLFQPTLMADIQSKEQRPQCEFCHKTFASKGSLKKHLPIHTGDCSKGFVSSSKLMIHVKNQDAWTRPGERPYCCEICGKAFGIAGSLKNHIRVHNGEKPFVCATCGKAFKQRGNLHRHERNHHSGEERFMCGVCGEKFKAVDQLKYHEENKGHFSCEISGENAVSGVQFDNPPSANKHQCELCAKFFSTKATLLKHFRTVHHGECPFVCSICGKGFGQNHQLQRHQESHFPVKRQTNRPYVCCFCEKAFSCSNYLRKHLKGIHAENLNDSEDLYLISEVAIATEKIEEHMHMNIVM